MAGRLPNTVTALLVVLTVFVQVAAIWAVADPLQAVEAPAPVQTSENDASSALPIVVVVLAELAVIYGAWLVYQRLPAWAQRWIKRALVAGLALYALLYALVILPALFIAYAAIVVSYFLGYRWMAYNIGGLVLGIVIAATLGGWLGPVPLIVLLVGLMVYDWVAVVETSVMDRMVKLMSGMGLPVMLVVPKRLNFDIGAFLSTLADDGTDLSGWRDRVHTVVGVGDFAIPAALTVAVYRFHGPTVAMAVLVGTVAGMIVLTSELQDEELPGLPWLGGGAIVGYVGGVSAVLLGIPMVG